MSEHKRDPLDEALAALPREVMPGRDLWPQIRTELERAPAAGAAAFRERSWSRPWLQLAAGVLLVVASSATTYVVTRRALQPDPTQVAQLPLPATSAQPVSFSFGQHPLGSGYVKARAELEQGFQQRVAKLSPSARAKLERNLADLRAAAQEISRALAQHPSDPLLQELLLSTYQNELDLLADVSELPVAGSMRADL